MITSTHTASVSLARLRAYEHGRAPDNYAKYELLLFGFIIVLLLVTLGAGVGVYSHISQQRWADEQNRTGLSLIANSVHITDAIDAVGVGVGPEGQALVLTERFAEGAYETRIYLYKGAIVEEYALAGAPYAPDKATPLVDSSSFSFSYADRLLSVRTDQGDQEIMLRSVRRATTSAAPHASSAEGAARER